MGRLKGLGPPFPPPPHSHLHPPSSPIPQPVPINALQKCCLEGSRLSVAGSACLWYFLFLNPVQMCSLSNRWRQPSEKRGGGSVCGKMGEGLGGLDKWKGLTVYNCKCIVDEHCNVETSIVTDKHGTQTVSHRGVCPSAVQTDADGDGGYKPRAGDMWLPVLLLPSVHGGFTEGSVAATALLCGVWHSDKAVFFFFSRCLIWKQLLPLDSFLYLHYPLFSSLSYPEKCKLKVTVLLFWSNDQMPVCFGQSGGPGIRTGVFCRM